MVRCESDAEDGDVITGTFYTDGCEVETSTITAIATETFVWDYMVPVHVARNTDEPTATNTTAAPVSTTSHASSTETTSSDSDTDSEGLSTGAIIAIAVVIPVVAISIALAAFLIWRKRRSKTAVMSPLGENYDALPSKDKHQLNDYNYGPPGELISKDSYARVPELPTPQTQFMHELPAEDVIRTPTESLAGDTAQKR